MSTFTNTTRIRKLYVNVFLDQIAGNGAYVCYITIQRAGAGSAYETIRTTKDAASGITAIVFNSMPITLNATDVMKTYVIGLAGDTTTVDIIVEVNEELPFTGADVIETAGSITAQQALSILLSALAGVTADGGATFKTPDGTATRIVPTINTSNERTAVTLTPSS